MAIQSFKMGPGTLKLNVPRSAAAVATTTSSTTITTTVPTFITGDVGAAITGTGIPVSTTISSVQSPYQATLSAAATATGSITATITPTGSVQDISCQFDEFAVKPEESVDTTDDFNALCGETLLGEETATYTWGVEGNFLQDLAAAGLVAYSWTNKGKQVAAEFIPNTVLNRKITFPVRVAPLDAGGKAKQRPTSALKWGVPRGFDPVLS